MKKTYFNSLKLLKWSINFALVIQVGIILIATFAITASIIDDDSDLQSNWPITVNQNLSSQSLTSDSADIFDVALHVSEGTLQYSSTSMGYILLKILDAVLVVSVTLLVTLLLRRVIISLSNNSPFSLDNAHRLRRISYLLLIITPYKLLQSYVCIYYIKAHITPEDATFTKLGFTNSEQPLNEILLHTEFDFPPLFIGLLVLVIAEIFRLGVELKEDNEAII